MVTTILKAMDMLFKEETSDKIVAMIFSRISTMSRKIAAINSGKEIHYYVNPGYFWMRGSCEDVFLFLHSFP